VKVHKYSYEIILFDKKTFNIILKSDTKRTFNDGLLKMNFIELIIMYKINIFMNI
jgi:hypothetical protein